MSAAMLPPTEIRGLPAMTQARVNLGDQRRLLIVAWRAWLEMQPTGSDVRHEAETTLNMLEQVRRQVMEGK